MFCVPSASGENCDIYINECHSNPCLNGNCINDINNYHCECDDGYEGVNCENEIDECERYRPCVHGSCYDLKASYYCSCISGYGGRNCSVKLNGCKGEPCQNNGTCKPYLEDEMRQLFNCSCTNGYHGHTCNKPTTMSLNHNSAVVITSSNEKGYDIQFRFKTSLPDGDLAYSPSSPSYMLYLQNGILILRTYLLNNRDELSIGSGLGNGFWQKVAMAINVSHLVLVVNEEQIVYPINKKSIYPNDDGTFFSGFFVGCVQDVNVNGQWVLPNEKQENVLFDNIEVGCTRTSQCEPNPCQGGGHCTDLWETFNCTCTRPYVGKKCEYSYTAATFWKENVHPSPVVVTLSEWARNALRNEVDISMFIRTNQKQGGIFYLGSKPSTLPSSTTWENFIIAHLIEGELQVQIQFNGIFESYGVPDIKLDDGYYHLIQVVLNYSPVQVQLKINHTEYVRNPIRTSGRLDLQTLYLGGLPEVLRPTQHANIARPASVISMKPVPPAYFKGVIQDVQVSNGENVMIVEFFPIQDTEGKLKLPPSLGSVEINTTSVLRGVLYDDTCKNNPCENNRTCRVIWNDYECNCMVGFKGERCNEIDFCTKPCPDGSRCQSLVYGYECVANVTLSGNSTGLQYRLVKGEISSALDTISISYQTYDEGTLLHIVTQHMPYKYFTISTNFNKWELMYTVRIAWNFTKDHNVLYMNKTLPLADWKTIMLKMDSVLSGGLYGALGDSPEQLEPTNFPIVEWHDFIASANIYIGSVGGRESLSNIDFSLYNKTSRNYKGCIGEVRIGGLLLPYFTPEYTMPDKTMDYFNLQNSSHASTIGCQLCFDSYCMNGGVCEDPASLNNCVCGGRYHGTFCDREKETPFVDFH